MEDVTVASVRQGADVVPSHRVGQEADGGLPVRRPGKGHVLATQEVPAMKRDKHEELRLARHVSEHLEGLTANVVGRHRTSLSTLWES
jgi:hypothetical protein